jgi:hypothetical protein
MNVINDMGSNSSIKVSQSLHYEKLGVEKISSTLWLWNQRCYGYWKVDQYTIRQATPMRVR